MSKKGWFALRKSYDITAEQGMLWNSINNHVATVEENGIVKTIGTSIVTIMSINKDGGFTASCITTLKDSQDPVQITTPTPYTTTSPTTSGTLAPLAVSVGYDCHCGSRAET